MSVGIATDKLNQVGDFLVIVMSAIHLTNQNLVGLAKRVTLCVAGRTAR